MRRLVGMLSLMSAVAVSLAAQMTPATTQVAPPENRAKKVDSIAVTLSMPLDDGLNAVVGAFTNVGLHVSATSPFLITSDFAASGSLTGGGDWMISIVATVFSQGDKTVVVIRGDKVRGMRDAGQDALEPGNRIDSQSRGKDGQAWRLMQAVAARLVAP